MVIIDALTPAARAFEVLGVTPRAVLISDTTDSGKRYRIVIDSNELYEKLTTRLTPDQTYPLIFEYETLFSAKRDFTLACLSL